MYVVVHSVTPSLLSMKKREEGMKKRREGWNERREGGRYAVVCIPAFPCVLVTEHFLL